MSQPRGRSLFLFSSGRMLPGVRPIAALFFALAVAGGGAVEAQQVDGLAFTDIRWMPAAKYMKFYTEISDHVSDGCWTGAAGSKDVVDLELLRSGATLEAEGDRTDPTIFVSAIGYGMGHDSCAVLATLDVWVTSSSPLVSEGREIFTLARTQLWSTKTLLTGPKSTMNERIRKAH